jgi:hypothetical protein
LFSTQKRARVSGSGNPKHKDRFEKHKRLAAAAAIADALGSGDLFETLSRWSAVAGVALLPGMLQQLTQETASNAAMASNLAASAGWGLVATLLHKTSKELVRRVGAWTNPGTAFDALYGVQSASTTH